MFCMNCGKELQGASFCPDCGTKKDGTAMGIERLGTIFAWVFGICGAGLLIGGFAIDAAVFPLGWSLYVDLTMWDMLRLSIEDGHSFFVSLMAITSFIFPIGLLGVAVAKRFEACPTVGLLGLIYSVSFGGFVISEGGRVEGFIWLSGIIYFAAIAVGVFWYVKTE